MHYCLTCGRPSPGYGFCIACQASRSITSQFREDIESYRLHLRSLTDAAKVAQDLASARSYEILGDFQSSKAPNELALQVKQWVGMHNLEIDKLKNNLAEGLSAVERQAPLAAYMPEYNDLAKMAASAKPAWDELVARPSAGYALAALASLREAIERAPFAEETIVALHSQLGDWSGIGLSAKLFDQEERQQVYLLNGLDQRFIDLEPYTFDAMLLATDLKPATLLPPSNVSVEAKRKTAKADEERRVAEAPEERRTAVVREEPGSIKVHEEPTVEAPKERNTAGDQAEWKTVENPKADVEAYQLLRTFEPELRAFVAKVLSEAIGPEWSKQRVPGECLKRWREKQDNDRKARKKSSDLLSYADLGDWSMIICRRDNWPLFKTYFNRPTFVEESFNRLIPLRNDLAHMRSLTRADRLVFYAEILQLRSAIRYPEAGRDIDFEPEDLLPAE
jgi:Swt1-like HEPN